jgi:uncharacterized membrane protein
MDNQTTNEKEILGKSTELFAVAFLLGFYFLCVGTTLDWHCLWLDEITTVRVIQYDWQTLIENRAKAGHPPIFFAIQKVWSSVWGVSSFSVRFLPYLFGGISLIVVYRLLTTQFSDRAAFWACLILAFSPAQLWIAQMARSYSLFQMLFLMNVLLIVYSTRFRFSQALVSSLLAALAVYTHAQAFLWIPVLMIAIVACYPEKWWFVPSLGIGLASYLPFANRFHETLDLADHAVLLPDMPIQDYFVIPARFYFGATLRDIPFWIQCIFAVAIVTVLVAHSLRHRVSRFVFFQMVIGIAAGFYAASTGRNFIPIERYWAPVYPVVAMAAGVGIDSILAGSTWSGFTRRRLVGLTLAAVCCCSFGLYLYRSPTFDGRATAKLLFEERKIGEQLIICCRYYHWGNRLWYYYPKGDSRVVEGDATIPPPGSERSWILVHSDWDGSPEKDRARESFDQLGLVVEREYQTRGAVLFNCTRSP